MLSGMINYLKVFHEYLSPVWLRYRECGPGRIKQSKNIMTVCLIFLYTSEYFYVFVLNLICWHFLFHVNDRTAPPFLISGPALCLKNVNESCSKMSFKEDLEQFR